MLLAPHLPKAKGEGVESLRFVFKSMQSGADQKRPLNGRICNGLPLDQRFRQFG